MSLRIMLVLLSFILTGCQEDKQKLNGYVEAEYAYIAPTTSGILKVLHVKRGDQIKQGDKLFEIEDTDLKTTLEKAKSAILESESLLTEDLKAYSRAQRLLTSNVISKSEFEKKEAEYLVSKARLETAKQSLIAAERKLEDLNPLAQEEAYVENTFFVPGEFVPLGKSVLSTFSYNDVKIRFFIPHRDLPKIKLQQTVYVSCDGCSKEIAAKITYISKKAEYTPPVIYSKDSREKMVFLVEAKPEAKEVCLHPGLPVDIEMRP